MERFYDILPPMECLTGDTLDTFIVNVSDFDDLSGCTMQVILEAQDNLGVAAKVKTCTPVDGGFEVRLTSEDTSGLHGVYNMHFAMRDTDGLVYRKLAGTLTVRRTVQGGLG